MLRRPTSSLDDNYTMIIIQALHVMAEDCSPGMPVDPPVDGETIILHAGAAIVVQIGIPMLL